MNKKNIKKPSVVPESDGVKRLTPTELDYLRKKNDLSNQKLRKLGQLSIQQRMMEDEKNIIFGELNELGIQRQAWFKDFIFPKYGEMNYDVDLETGILVETSAKNVNSQ